MSSPAGHGSPSPPELMNSHHTVQALPAQPQSSSNPRRLPPPCWSHDETVALIDGYRDKWYTLRRGNLKANHWQEVADNVSRRCPAASPPKTAVQCRHKMEKLRKRYRTEIQRARSMPVSRFSSSWVHFKRMDAMEKGPQAKTDYNSESEGDGDEDGDEEDDDVSNTVNQGLYIENHRNGNPVTSSRSIPKLYRNGIPGNLSSGSGGIATATAAAAAASGFRIRIPTGVSIASPGPNPKFYPKIESKYGVNPNLNPNLMSSMKLNPQFGGSSVSGSGLGSSRTFRAAEESGKKKEREPMEEMVTAIKVLGDGFVRTEQMKMEMAREIESMRMDMEMKRTEMILESQQRIVEAFAKAFSEKTKKKKQQMPKRMASPEES
ncbi:Alcohol dehydrogenase transcription factor Myb/SANT-like family protein [Euphorbia peplus]|nr:Alcohol dehydrogenase transcription factor Myb/SANT-like family protein [Euphorbia peplus]